MFLSATHTFLWNNLYREQGSVISCKKSSRHRLSEEIVCVAEYDNVFLELFSAACQDHAGGRTQKEENQGD